MKRLVLATTSLVVAGSMAAADYEISGSGELGVAGKSGEAVKLHKDLEVKFGLSGATDTGLMFGGSIDLDEAGSKAASATVYIDGAFGKLTLGDVDSAYDNVLAEADMGGAIASDHTSHAGFEGNGGLTDFSGNGGNTLRYDYKLGGITASVSGEFSEADSSHSSIGVGVKMEADIGGVGMTFGLGWQGGSGKMEIIDGALAVAAIPAMPGTAHTDAVAPVDAVYACQATSLNPSGTDDDASDDVLYEALSGTIGADTNCMTHAFAADGTAQNAAVTGVEYILVVTNQAAVAGTPRVAAMPATPFEAAKPAIEDSYDNSKASIIGASWSVDMGNGLTTVLNYSRRTDETSNSVRDANNSMSTTTQMGLGVGYTVGAITVGVNGGSKTAKTGATEVKSSGVGVGVKYGLGEGVDFLVGASSGKEGMEKSSQWSAGLSFKF